MGDEAKKAAGGGEGGGEEARRAEEGAGRTASSGGQASGGRIDKIVETAGAMKERAGAVRSEIADMRKEGSAASGMVKVTVDGTGALRAVSIDPSLMGGEAAVLEELIVSAAADARAGVAAEAGSRLDEALEALPLPASITAMIRQILPVG